MKKILKGSGLAIALMLGFAASPVNAMPIPAWDFSIDSGWANALDQAGRAEGAAGATLLTSSGGGLNKISWGTNLGNGQSSLAVNDNVSGTLITNGGSVAGASVTHNNVVIGITNNVALDTVDLVVDINLAPAGNALAPFGMVTFNIDFFESPNSGTCPSGSTSVCDDVFLLLNPADLSQSFAPGDGFIYTLTLALDTSGLSFFEVLGNGTLRFLTEEGNSNTLFTNLSITAMEIPAPAMLALFGLGLIGVGALQRRKV